MQRETIGKVIIDYTAATTSDTYSDGDIEDVILDALKNGHADELLHNSTNYAVLYHLSPVRHNLVAGLDFPEGASVLEIGAGCGGITGILCQKAAAVTAVELTARRAKIAAYRNQDCNNLTIRVGNLNDMAFSEKFDVITLIGVLEYAASFTHTAAPYHDFLAKVKSLLKPDGMLIIAIENRLGMKYFSGAAEDHTGVLFRSITGYPKGSHVQTFAKTELTALLESVGFQTHDYYYPHPDYKIPNDVFSDRHLPTRHSLLDMPNLTYDVDRVELFSENAAFATVIDAGLYPIFANSFLVLASPTNYKSPQVAVAWHVAPYRKPTEALLTRHIERNGKLFIQKMALSPAARPHLQRYLENGQILTQDYGEKHIPKSYRLTDDLIEIEYAKGKSLMTMLIEDLERASESQFEGILNRYLNFYADHLLCGTEDDSQPTSTDHRSPNRRYNIDLHFDNIIVDGRLEDANFQIIDYEWLVPTVSQSHMLIVVAEYIIWRIEMRSQLNLDLIRVLLNHLLGITEEDIQKYSEDKLAWLTSIQQFYRDNYLKRRHGAQFNFN